MKKLSMAEIMLCYSHIFGDDAEQIATKISELHEARIEDDAVYLPDWLVSLMDENGGARVRVVNRQRSRQYGMEWGREVVRIYNEVLGEYLPCVTVLSPRRVAAIAARSREQLKTLDDWARYFNIVRESPFLLGVNNHGWRASLDWLLRPNNFAKVYDGMYRQQQRQVPQRDALQDRAYEVTKYMYELFRVPPTSSVLQHPLRDRVYRALHCVADGKRDDSLRDLLDNALFTKIAREVAHAAANNTILANVAVEQRDRDALEGLYRLVVAMVRPA